MENNTGKYIIYLSNMSNIPIDSVQNTEILVLRGIAGSLFHLTPFPQNNEKHGTIWYEKKFLVERPIYKLDKSLTEKITDYFEDNGKMVTFLMTNYWDEPDHTQYLLYCSNKNGKPIQELEEEEQKVLEGKTGILNEIIRFPDDNINRWYNKPYLLERLYSSLLTPKEAREIKQYFENNGKIIEFFTKEITH